VSSYRFAYNGQTLIVSGPDGYDELQNIEMLIFAISGSISVSSLVSGGYIEEVVTTSTGGVNTIFLPDTYSGPVGWLRYQVLGSNASDIAVGTLQNDFFNLLGGDDACSAGAGDDVLDGGTGSNFLTGGTGRDDFFLDGRGGTTTWATITDWQPGERLSVWGWRPGVSTAQWVASAGATGFTGVTIHGDLDGNGVIAGLNFNQLPTPLEFDGLLWFT
jgi:serralysin